MRARPAFSQVDMARIAVKRGVRLSSGHGSAGPSGSGFGLIRTGWRAPSIRFRRRPLRRQRPLPALAARGLDGADGHVELESTPIPLTPFMPPLGGLRHPANWPLRTRPGSCSPAPNGSSRGCTPPRCTRRCRARPRRAWRRPARARTPTSRCP